MAPIRDLETVVRAGLCSGCGLCASVAGAERVEMAPNAIGQLRPRVKAPLPPEVLDEALAVCPGVEVRGPGRRRTPIASTVWGPIESLQRGWAADPAVRFRAAAGGS